MIDVKLFRMDPFVSEPEEALLPALRDAQQKLQYGTGAGREFTGWVHLPRSYDRAEFARIQQAAVRIQSHSKALVVIGIGGSYLGARASKVARRPPEGKEEASGSPRTSSLPENSRITLPPPTGLMKLSCFSAVTPVMGWNQWV